MTDLPLEGGRLPITVVPRHYDLKYTKIDLDRHVFDGALTMLATVPSETDRKSLLLHCLELQIISSSVISEEVPDETKAWAGIEYRYNISQQTVEIFFDDFSWMEQGRFLQN